MKMPNKYNETRAGGYTPPIPGGHICVIKKAEETLSKTGKPMLVVYLDFDDEDVQPRYFAEEFKNDIRPEKKWPFAGMKYIVTEDNDGNCSRSFKAFTTSIESSNECEFVWGDGTCSFLQGLQIGAVYGEEENEYNGNVTTRTLIRYFCDVQKALTAEVPKKKYLDGSMSAPVRSGAQTDVFAPSVDEELPFA